MIAFLLFVAVFAQEATDKTVGCGENMYFDVNSGEGGKCVELKNCNETHADNLTGCKKCNDGYFNFRGQCHPCSCGDDAITCTDNLGCPRCAKKHVMEETKNQDGSVMYTCVALPSERVDLNAQGVVYTEYQIHGPDTIAFCKYWGERGCLMCGANITDPDNIVYYYVNASMCYENTHCTAADNASDIGLESGNYRCTNCTKAEKKGDQSYYLVNGACVECDPNCVDCDVNTGVCKECFPGYYPLDSNSKKCYQCDPQCDIESCIQLGGGEALPPGSCTKCRSNAELNETYYLVANKYCIRMPSGCEEAQSNIGCTKCKDGYFLVPEHYNGVNNFHYKIAGVRIGMCVPHQQVCPEVNRTATGCIGCNPGYVLDTVKWTVDGKEYSILSLIHI